MWLIHQVIKEQLEAITGHLAYPMEIPQDAELPAMAYFLANVVRDEQSNLADTSVTEHTFGILLAAESFSVLVQMTTQVINAFDGTGGFGNVMSSEVWSVEDNYDDIAKVYRQIVQINLKVKE